MTTSSPPNEQATCSLQTRSAHVGIQAVETAPMARRRNGHAAWLAGLGIVFSSLVITPAHAELKVCNATPSRIGLAIGYRDRGGWTTEGWWNVAAQTCESLLKTPLNSRYLYVYAIDYERGGEWTGSHTMCINSKSFMIRTVDDCDQRGHRTADFYEVDTGDSTTWTIRLTDQEKTEGKAK